jgi:hypothetical protein
MGESGDHNGHTAARAMIDTFASVGAVRFNVTWTNARGDKQSFRAGVPTGQLIRILPGIIDYATEQQHNIIVRPYGPGVTFIQLDDLKADQLAHVAPAVFLTLETSSGNFQAWVALAQIDDKDFARRLRKGTGADATASGATRVAGSLNFKDKYAPDFPRVAITEKHEGRVTTTDELERLELVAAPENVAEPPRASPLPRSRPSGSNRKWPSYARCLEGAPLNSEETGPDTSRADFVWCMTALTWGWEKEEIAERLLEESPKARARKDGPEYARVTVINALDAVMRRKQQPKRNRGFG